MKRALGAALLLFLLLTRFCHLDIIWDDEGYPLAAAVQLLHGKQIYRDFWFDKPPLVAAMPLLWNARDGWPLRVAGALYVVGVCVLAWFAARRLWDERAGLAVAALLAFFLTFDMPAAVMTLGPDMLLLPAHIGAVYLAWRGRAFWAGVVAGIGLCANTKAVFVLAACVVIRFAVLPLVAGFALPTALMFVWLHANGAWASYMDQVWYWGVQYASTPLLERPFVMPLARTAGWLGFHGTLVAGVVWCLMRDREHRRRLLAWTVISFAAVAMGWRFFPRYYLHLLPLMALAGARGLTLMNRRAALAAALLLVVPFARFGPRYALLGRDLLSGRAHDWPDVALAQDSRDAARLIDARPGDTLLVWGYRPDLYALTRLPAGTPYLDSQPLTGILADRHLDEPRAHDGRSGREERARLTRHRPTYIADGLGPLNPRLSIYSYPDLEPWLEHYSPVGRTRYCVVYRLIQP